MPNYPKVYSLSKFKGRPGDQLCASLCTLPNRALCIDGFLGIYDELGERVSTLCLGDQLTLLLVYSDIIPDDEKKKIIKSASIIFEENWWIPEKEKNTDEAKKEKEKILSILKNFYNFSEALTLEEALKKILYIIYAVKMGDPFAQPTKKWSYTRETSHYEAVALPRAFREIINVNIPNLLIRYMKSEIERISGKEVRISYTGTGYLIYSYRMTEADRNYIKLLISRFGERYGLPLEIPEKISDKALFQTLMKFYETYGGRDVNIINGIDVVVDESTSQPIFKENSFEAKCNNIYGKLKTIYNDAIAKEVDLYSYIDGLVDEIVDRIISYFITWKSELLRMVTKNPKESGVTSFFRKGELHVSKSDLKLYLINLYKEKYKEDDDKVIDGLWVMVKKQLEDFCNAWYIPITISEDENSITIGTNKLDIETQKDPTYVYSTEDNMAKTYSLLAQRRILVDTSCCLDKSQLLLPLEEGIEKIGYGNLIRNNRQLLDSTALLQAFGGINVNIEVTLPNNIKLISYYKALLNTSFITNPPKNFYDDIEKSFRDRKPIEPNILRQATEKNIFVQELPDNKVMIMAFDVNLQQLLLTYAEETRRLESKAEDGMKEVKAKLLEPVNKDKK